MWKLYLRWRVNSGPEHRLYEIRRKLCSDNYATAHVVKGYLDISGEKVRGLMMRVVARGEVPSICQQRRVTRKQFRRNLQRNLAYPI